MYVRTFSYVSPKLVKITDFSSCDSNEEKSNKNEHMECTVQHYMGSVLQYVILVQGS